MTTLTRKELYDLVWDRPITKLAKEFGLSDVALHKICRKHEISTPPAGYWAKLAHGKNVTQAPLAAVEQDTPIVIRGQRHSSETEATTEARAKVHDLLASYNEEVPPSGSYPLIEKSIGALEARKRPDRDGLVKVERTGLIAIQSRPESISRARKLLEHIAAMAAHAGIELGVHEGKVAWLVGDEPVFFRLTELFDKVEHEPTEKELREIAKWEAEQEEKRRRWGYASDYGRPQIPKWEHHYNGHLSVQLEDVRDRTGNNHWLPAIRAKFSDTKTRDVFRMAPRIVATIAAIAVAKKENRVAEAIREKERREAEERRRDAEKSAAIERDRWLTLQKLVEEHDEAERVERYLLRLKTMAGEEMYAGSTSNLISWTENWLARRLNNICGKRLEERLKNGKFDGIYTKY